MEGYKARQDAEFYRVAWLAATVINHSGKVKRAVTPDKLLGRKKTGRKMPSKADQMLELQEIKARFKPWSEVFKHGEKA